MPIYNMPIKKGTPAPKKTKKKACKSPDLRPHESREWGKKMIKAGKERVEIILKYGLNKV